MANNITFPRLISDDRIINTLQNNTNTALQSLQTQINNSLSNGIFLNSISLISGNTIVPHTLGRTPVGFVLTDINTAANVFRVNYSASTLTLNSSAPCTVNFYLF